MNITINMLVAFIKVSPKFHVFLLFNNILIILFKEASVILCFMFTCVSYKGRMIQMKTGNSITTNVIAIAINDISFKYSEQFLKYSKLSKVKSFMDFHYSYISGKFSLCKNCSCQMVTGSGLR